MFPYLTYSTSRTNACRCLESPVPVLPAFATSPITTRNQEEGLICGIDKVKSFITSPSLWLTRNSDGSRHAINGRLQSANRQPRSTSGLRSEQPLEGVSRSHS